MLFNYNLACMIMINYSLIMTSLFLHSLAKRNQVEKGLGNKQQTNLGNLAVIFKICFLCSLLFPLQHLVQSSLQSL